MNDDHTITITISGAIILAVAIAIGMTIGGVGMWAADELLDRVLYGSVECQAAPMIQHGPELKGDVVL